MVSKYEMALLPKIVAVDFDGTLVEDKYPKIGQPILAVFDVVKGLKANGVKVILWTCRDGKYLEEAVNCCRSLGLEFDAINENIEETKTLFGNDTRKVYANLYIDDKNWDVSYFKYPDAFALLHNRLFR